jgi:hypothetical protein
MIARVRVCVHVDVFRTLVPPAILCTVDQRMLILGLVNTVIRLKRQLTQSQAPRPRTLGLHAHPTWPVGTASRDRFAPLLDFIIEKLGSDGAWCDSASSQGWQSMWTGVHNSVPSSRSEAV